MALPSQTSYTPAEYLALERKAEYKSEYLHGEIYAMAGASREHNLIAGNLLRLIGNQLVDRLCEVYSSDMKVQVVATGLIAYPDVVAVCGEAHFIDVQTDTLTNPTMIAEILSPSTEAYDRGTKFAHYRKIPSLQEYLLLAQDKPLVEHYVRSDMGWLLTEISDPDDTLRLDSIGCTVVLREIYHKVKFPTEDASPAEDGSSLS